MTNPAGIKAEETIRRMRREGKSWSEVSDWIARQVGYDIYATDWAKRIYNDEGRKERRQPRKI